MVRLATISVKAAASAPFRAAELPPPGTGSPDAVLARYATMLRSFNTVGLLAR
jgi:hypothetical protein